MAKVLVTKGRLTLGMVSKRAELKLRDTRESLFVLVQQNLVTVNEELDPKSGKTLIYYQSSIEAILQRLLFPMIILAVLDECGDDVTFILFPFSFPATPPPRGGC